MRAYETAFLIAPNLAEDETEDLIQQMAGIIAQKKGKMMDLDKWGKRKLAYSIGKFDAAFYVFFRYSGNPDIPAELERRFKQTEAVLRYLTVTMEEEGKVRISRKKRSGTRPADRRPPHREGGERPAPKKASEEKTEAPPVSEPSGKVEPEAASASEAQAPPESQAPPDEGKTEEPDQKEK